MNQYLKTSKGEDRLKKSITKIYLSIMLGQSVLWIVLSIMLIIKSIEFYPQIIIGILMIGNAIAFGVFALLYKKNNILIKLLTFVFLFANLILTFTDQMGVLDFIVLLLNIIVVICYIILLRNRKIGAEFCD